MVVTAPPPPLPDSDHDVDGGVIEDARARQRRHHRLWRALIAPFAIGALIAGLVDGGGGSTAPQHSQGLASNAAPGGHGSSSRAPAFVAPIPELGEFGLLAPRVGWLVDSGVVYLTRDGGRSWTHRGLSALGARNAQLWSSSRSPGEIAFSLADGGQAQLTIPKGASAADWAARHVRGHVALTTNIGGSWSSHPFVSDISPAALSFPNGRVGFALAYTAAAHHDPRASLYQTRSGGRTWARVAPVPFQGLLSFADARDGLGGGWSVGAGLVDGAAIYRTNSGGRTWARTSLCRPAVVYSCEAPILLSGGHGVVPVIAHNRQTGMNQVEIFTTRDDGATWTRHTLPNTPKLGDNTYIPLSAPNAKDLFAWVSPYLYASTNGGVSWSRHAIPMLTAGTPSPLFSDIAFANSSYGWYANGPVFAYTTDGGKHWTKFRHPQ